MKYKTRRTWRHFKYKILEVFFGKQELRKFLDIDRLDFEDAVKLTGIQSEMTLTVQEHDYFTRGKDIKYGLQYQLARQMADTLANHVKVSEIMDIDTKTYTVIGSVVLAERKEA
jgi:hypothetical protein